MFAICACGGGASPTSPVTARATPPLASASASAPANAEPPPSALIESALRSHKAYDLAESLADEVGPRLAGSDGDALAVRWAERTMRELGFANVHTEVVTVPVWKRGAETAEILEPHQTLAVTALGWSGATPKEGVTAEVMEVESFDALMKLPKDSAKGKILFANVVMPRTDDGRGYGMTVPVRTEGPKAAMNAGAVAFVVRSLSTSADRFPHAGSASLRDVAKPIAAAALAVSDADLLHRAIARLHSVKMKLVLTPERSKDAQSANVVGEIVGTTKKDEVVLLGAHLDSWDLARGAIDDGAGCGIVLQAAHLLGEHAHPSRTIRVVLFAAEENSAAGAKAYLAAHEAEVSRIVLAMEADSGTERVRFVRYLGDPAKVDAFDAIARALHTLGIARGDGDAHAGTDISPLVTAGVPMIEARQDASQYFDTHHSANDTAERLDADGLAQVSATFAEVAYRVSELEGDLGRVPESKRKHEWSIR